MNFINKISTNGIILFFGAVFFIRNLLIPFVSDDFSYAFIWNGAGGGNIAFGISDNLQRVDSFYDIFISQWNHYFTWGGRTVAHTLIQFFVWTGKTFFDIANTIMLILLVLLICWNAKTFSRLSIIWIFFSICVCIPEWVSTMLWLTGACNYMWMAVLQLLFLTPYNLNLKIPIYIILPMGIIAGWSNEAGGFATLIAAFFFTFQQRKNLQRWQITGLISFTIGYLLLMLSPGNLARAQILNYTQFNFNIEILIEHTKIFLHILSSESILFLPIIYCLIKRNSLNKIITIFTIAAIFVPMIMIFSPEFPDRSCFSSTIFLTVASTSALNVIIIEKLYPKWLTLKNKFIFMSSIGILLIWLIGIAGCFYADLSLHRQFKQRIELVTKMQGKDLIVPKLQPSYRLEKFLGLRIYHSLAIQLGGDLREDSRWGQNVCFSKYYGLKSISTLR